MTTEKPKTLQELFSKDGSWTQFALWRDENGDYHHNNDTAISWCLGGGVIYVYGHYHENGYDIFKKINKEIEIMGYNDLVLWNNEPGRTIEDIRELVKKLDI